MIEGVDIIRLPMAKSFLLTCDERLVLVDTGLSQESAQKILDHLKSIGRKPGEVELCVITHHHRDHVGGLRRLKEACGFRVASHAEDIEKIERDTGVKVDLRLKDGETLPHCGGVRVVHVPGHTRGNICLYLEQRRAIIAGDTVFGDEEGNLNPPPEAYCEDVDMAKRELRRLLRLDFEAVLVSHGRDVYSGGKEKLKALVS